MKKIILISIILVFIISLSNNLRAAPASKISTKNNSISIEKEGFLGVVLISKGDEVIIKKIIDGAAADKANLKAGDVLLEINGVKINSLEEAISLIKKNKPESKVKLRIRRGIEEKTVKAKMEGSPKKSSSIFSNFIGNLSSIFSSNTTFTPSSPVSNIKSFEPSRITLDMKSVKVSEILKEIEKQTGNKLKMGKKVNNITIERFKVDNKTFWPVLDKLCKRSGNAYKISTRKGGG
jgi:membrane-associated protease RseP (regulator of RpoE activity)